MVPFITILLFLVMFIIGVVLINNGVDKDSTKLRIAGIVAILCSIILPPIYFAYNVTKDSNNSPKTINVYLDETTLEITCRDSILIDTIVVFKREFKK